MHTRRPASYAWYLNHQIANSVSIYNAYLLQVVLTLKPDIQTVIEQISLPSHRELH
jgi:hypothetical protein